MLCIRKGSLPDVARTGSLKAIQNYTNVIPQDTKTIPRSPQNDLKTMRKRPQPNPTSQIECVEIQGRAKLPIFATKKALFANLLTRMPFGFHVTTHPP